MNEVSERVLTNLVRTSLHMRGKSRPDEIARTRFYMEVERDFKIRWTRFLNEFWRISSGRVCTWGKSRPDEIWKRDSTWRLNEISKSDGRGFWTSFDESRPDEFAHEVNLVRTRSRFENSSRSLSDEISSRWTGALGWKKNEFKRFRPQLLYWSLFYVLCLCFEKIHHIWFLDT